jgi:hypothetical protein
MHGALPAERFRYPFLGAGWEAECWVGDEHAAADQRQPKHAERGPLGWESRHVRRAVSFTTAAGGATSLAHGVAPACGFRVKWLTQSSANRIVAIV